MKLTKLKLTNQHRIKKIEWKWQKEKFTRPKRCKTSEKKCVCETDAPKFVLPS